jgi:hypothetical protein
MSEVVESEFRGKPTLVLRNTADDTFPFQFGVRKARLVLAHIDDIRKFVLKHDKN